MRNTVSPLPRPWGKPTAREAHGGWVKEGGGSEGRSVMERIGVEPKPSNITPLRKEADFRRVVPHVPAYGTSNGG